MLRASRKRRATRVVSHVPVEFLQDDGVSQVLTPLGTLSSGLGRQNHQSALMRCHQRHFPGSAVMMARL
jgi:hypothetical protein